MMSLPPKTPDEFRAAESRRILASVNDEMQVSGLGNSLASRVGNHFNARDGDQNDKVEDIGKRIGRIFSLLLCLGLMVWLAMFVLNHGS